MRQICGKQAPLEPNRCPASSLELAPGATNQQARFALLAAFLRRQGDRGRVADDVVRQGLAVLLDGSLALVVHDVCQHRADGRVLFSAIVAERRTELGLLKAIGARRGQIVGMLLTRGRDRDRRWRLDRMSARRVAAAAVRALAGLSSRQIGIPFLWLDGAPSWSRWPASCRDRCRCARALCPRHGAPAGRNPTSSSGRRAEPMLACRDLAKTYPTERGGVEAVSGIDLDVGAVSLPRSLAARAPASRR